MPVLSTLISRRAELRRRVEALPAEINAWKQRTSDDLDKNAHFSQLLALDILMSTLLQQQRALLDGLDPRDDPEAFRVQADQLVGEIIKTQRTWDFFRDKLDLRFSPTFKDPLWVADTVAWDCYRPVLETAADYDILSRSQLREPPLSYLTAEFSPATWVRGSRPFDGRDYELGTARLPIPVIELPWDHVENVWEFLSLHHEVGHDLEADLSLRQMLLSSLQSVLSDAGVPAERIQVWKAWEGEVFSDLVGLQLGGPAFADMLMHLLLLPAKHVTTYNPRDPHPTHYVRVLMNAAYIPTLVNGRQELVQHAGEIESRWKELYGEQPQFQGYVDDFPHVFKALMDTGFEALKGQTVRGLIPFTAGDDARIRAAANYLITGQNAPAPGSLRPRHCISAARIAVTQAALEPETLDQKLTTINEKTQQLVRDNAPKGLRAGDESAKHKAFIAGFAANLP